MIERFEFTDEHRPAPEAGDRDAVIVALSALGLLPRPGNDRGNDLAMECPNDECRARNRTGEWCCHIDVQTTQWLCWLCQRRGRYPHRGNLTTLLNRAGLRRRTRLGETRYHARRGEHSTGANDEIRAQSLDAKRMLDSGRSYSEVVAALVNRYHVSIPTAKRRIAAVRDDRFSRRRSEVNRQAQLFNIARER